MWLSVLLTFINHGFITRHSDRSHPSQPSLLACWSWEGSPGTPPRGRLPWSSGWRASVPSTLNSAPPFVLLFWIWELPFKNPQGTHDEQALSPCYRQGSRDPDRRNMSLDLDPCPSPSEAHMSFVPLFLLLQLHVGASCLTLIWEDPGSDCLCGI